MLKINAAAMSIGNELYSCDTITRDQPKQLLKMHLITLLLQSLGRIHKIKCHGTLCYWKTISRIGIN